MKYCPDCGSQLLDEAKFCTTCGAKQPIREKVEEVKEEPKKEEPKKEVKQELPKGPAPELKKEESKAVVVLASEATPEVKATNDNVPPAQRYKYLMENDEAFSTIVKSAKKRDRLSLFNLLFIVIWLVCSFMPILVFTGINISSEGRYELEALGKSIPTNFGGLELWVFSQIAGDKAVSPSSMLTGILPFIAFIFGFLFIALIILIAVLGFTKGFALKSYEKGGAKGLVSNLSGSRNFIGALLGLVPLMAMIVTYVQAMDLDYSKGGTYLFGQIAVQQDNLILAIIISSIVIVFEIIVGIIVSIWYKAKIRKFIK